MSQQNRQKKRLSKKRIFFTFLPLLALLLIMLIVNLLASREQKREAAPVQTAVSTTHPVANSAATRPPILPATILATLAPMPTPTPTNMPHPSLPDTANITLIGPPDNSSLRKNSTVSFYWTYSEQLQPGQQFIITLRQNGQALASGTVREVNLGTDYQWQIDLKETDIEPGTAVWQIGLQWANEEQWLIPPSERSLIILPQ